MINYDKITDIFCIVDEFQKEFDSVTQKFILGNKPKQPPKMSSLEVISIALFFHLSGFRCFKHFYLFYVQRHMTTEFPKAVSYNRFTRN